MASDEERLRAIYQVPFSIQIMIPNLRAKDSDPPTEGWIAFHEKSLWLGVSFHLYDFIRKCLKRI